MKALALAVQFMTRLPFPAIAGDERDFGRAIRWFPVAGLLVGGGVAGAAWLGLQRDPWTGALLALLAWAALTGALHLDGLGDIADGVGAAHGDRDRLSAVLADPHVGSFGVTAICLQIAAKLVLLKLALESHMLWPIVLAAVLARAGPLAWSLMLPPLHEGMGTLFRAGANWWIVAAWLAAFAVTAAVAAPAMLLALPAIPLWAWWLRRRIGGISGDGHGAGIELVETAVLAALVFAG
jgi:adenosylcobinamide-GDP ribazoletransferase